MAKKNAGVMEQPGAAAATLPHGKAIIPEGTFEEMTAELAKQMEEYRRKAGPVLEKARILAVLDQPFFSVLLYNLEWEEAWWLPTLATDGKHLYYNPSFVCQLPPAELVTGLCHEAWHAAADHPGRKSTRSDMRWNHATDHCVNVGLKKAGAVMPSWALADEKLALDSKGVDRSPEEIYKLLPEEPECTCGEDGEGGEGDGDEKDGEGGGQGKGKDGGNGGKECPKHGKGQGGGKPQGQGHVLGGGCTVLKPDGSETEAERKLRIQSALSQAETAARSRGKLPGELQTLLDRLRNPMFDYRAVLEPFLRDAMESEWDTWAKPDHRMLAAIGRMLPSPTTEPSGELVIVFDTSGSVADAELQSFVGFTNGVLETLTALKKVTVIQCDAAMQGEPQVFDKRDLPIVGPKLRIHGRGGTDFRPPFTWMEEKYEGRPSALIYLTDLEGPSPEVGPDYPVLWVCVRDVTPSQCPAFGTVARIRVGEEE